MDFIKETGYVEETTRFVFSFAPMEDLMETLEMPARVKSQPASCKGDHYEQSLMGMRDAIDVLSGKWKVRLIGTLLFGGKMRFMDLLREVDGIAAKMLSKELHDLEAHQLIKRTVMQTRPVTVEYEITPYGRSLEKVLQAIVEWGLEHRRTIMGRGDSADHSQFE